MSLPITLPQLIDWVLIVLFAIVTLFGIITTLMLRFHWKHYTVTPASFKKISREYYIITGLLYIILIFLLILFLYDYSAQ